MNLQFRLLTLWVLSMGALFNVQGQGINPYVSDEVIVKADISDFGIRYAPDLNQIIRPHRIKSIERLAQNFDLFLIRLESGDDILNIDRVISALSQIEYLSLIQKNHIGDFRNTPSDELFFQQWYLQNTGQNNGVPGADINILEAWKYTTGGKTMEGEDIVVAVIDAGIDNTHRDLATNFWVNQKEIPDNGIDDDGNGYIDDYYGWNANFQNGDISSNGSHGTLVSGIIGGIGNNEIGISGMNWQIKIMPVILSIVVESAVIRAYDYVLTQRKRYNSTHGKEGALVVATNSSWGLDYGRAEDSPLWCMMYDALGAEGILNAAATTNLNINVDIQGDLPSTCDSDYLISVTSSNRNDGRARAGFGVNHVHLAAPGEQILSTRSRDRFGTENGTSFACPMVAGCIGLMYSLHSYQFINLVKNDPAKAALELKSIILESSTPLEAFVNRTITRGRLNVGNAVELFLQRFNSCPEPSEIELIDFENNALIIAWKNPNDSLVDNFNLRYRKRNDPDWIELFSVESPLRIEGLLSCSEYEIQLQSICLNADPSLFSDSFVFLTDSCCEGPRVIDTLLVRPNAVRLQWREVLPSDAYIVEIALKDSRDWIRFTTDQNQILIRNLRFCSEYEVRIASICNLDTSEYSNHFIFTTTGCGVCTEGNYCLPDDGDSEFLNIEFSSIGTTVNDLLRMPQLSYEDYTFLASAGIERGGSLAVELEYSMDEFIPEVNIAVWIDFDHDGKFNESNERVIYIRRFPESVLLRNINIPFTAKIGTTRMRIAVLDAGLHDTIVACPENFYFGKYEDYCVEILQQSCPGVPRLEANNISGNSANIVWDPTVQAIAYTFRWREAVEEGQQEKEWSDELSDTITMYTLSGLAPCKKYDFELRSVCLFDTSEYVRLTFDTDCPTSIPWVNLEDLNIRAYPNPFTHVLYLDFHQVKANDLSIHLYNTLGQLVRHTRLVISDQSSSLVELNSFEDLPQGIYFAEIIAGQHRAAVKLLKN